MGTPSGTTTSSQEEEGEGRFVNTTRTRTNDDSQLDMECFILHFLLSAGDPATNSLLLSQLLMTTFWWFQDLSAQSYRCILWGDCFT